jgi:multidrug resistance efflux pump
MTNAECQKRWRDKQRRELDQLRKENASLLRKVERFRKLAEMAAESMRVTAMATGRVAEVARQAEVARHEAKAIKPRRKPSAH